MGWAASAGGGRRSEPERAHDPHHWEVTMANQRVVIYAVGAIIVIVLVIFFAQN